MVHIFTLLPQFHMTVFISKFVRLHGVLLFKNKHICLAISAPQCEGLMSHLQVRMNEAEMLSFIQSCETQQEVPTRNILEMFSCLCGPTK